MKGSLAAAGLAVLLGGSPAAAELENLQIAARVNHDIGTIFVSGTESGPGGGVSVRLSFGDDFVRWEPELAIDVAGFRGEGDGDPIFQGTFLLSRKAYLGDSGGARTWWSIGAGAGGLAIAGGGAIFPARIAVGVSLAADESFGLELSVFDRFALSSTGGDPSTEYINSTGVELAVRFGR